MPVERKKVATKTIKDLIPDAPKALDLPLDQKYRPTTLEEMVGQKEVVKSLKSAFASKSPKHAYLFTGPAGTGKTTLARIAACHFGCSPQNTMEVDAASTTGIDAMRELTSTLRYQGFGDQPNKMFVIDECHALSKAAWQSLLKSVEEPPPHVFWAFCTTDPGKVPDTIVTRCASYNLKPVNFDGLMDLLEDVVKLEKLDPLPGVLDQIARACNGSPRQALTYLSMVESCETKEEAARLLESPLEDKEIIDLCRMLMKGDLTWASLTKTLKAIPETNAESIRIVVVNYINACIMGAKGDSEICRMLDILAAFSKPCNPTDKLAPILLAFGNLIYP